jgi:chromosome segregation ATPase
MGQKKATNPAKKPGKRVSTRPVGATSPIGSGPRRTKAELNGIIDQLMGEAADKTRTVRRLGKALAKAEEVNIRLNLRLEELANKSIEQLGTIEQQRNAVTHLNHTLSAAKRKIIELEDQIERNNKDQAMVNKTAVELHLAYKAALDLVHYLTGK